MSLDCCGMQDIGMILLHGGIMVITKTIIVPSEISKVVQMLRQYPNLYADLSAGSGLNALQRDSGFARDFVLEFQDRLLYGRDDFHTQLREFFDSLGLPGEVLAKVYAGNALKLVPERSPQTFKV